MGVSHPTRSVVSDWSRSVSMLFFGSQRASPTDSIAEAVSCLVFSEEEQENHGHGSPRCIRMFIPNHLVSKKRKIQKGK